MSIVVNVDTEHDIIRQVLFHEVYCRVDGSHSEDTHGCAESGDHFLGVAKRLTFEVIPE